MIVAGEYEPEDDEIKIDGDETTVVFGREAIERYGLRERCEDT